MNALRDIRKRPNVRAALYHLPLTMFERALPKLIGEGKLTDNEISGLIEYVMRAQELNRGLDLATAAATSGNEARVSEQWTRNVAKLGHILDEKLQRFDGETVFDTAETAIFGGLLRREPPTADLIPGGQTSLPPLPSQATQSRQPAQVCTQFVLARRIPEFAAPTAFSQPLRFKLFTRVATP